MSKSESSDSWIIFLLGVFMESISGHDTVFLILFSVVSEVVVDHFFLRDIVCEGSFHHFRVESRYIKA